MFEKILKRKLEQGLEVIPLVGGIPSEHRAFHSFPIALLLNSLLLCVIAQIPDWTLLDLEILSKVEEKSIFQ